MMGNQEPLPILQGKILQGTRGRYEIIKPIGKGGFGYTFLANDLTSVVNTRYCVVKLLRMDIYHPPEIIAGIKEAFEKEAETLEKLGERSGNIPSLYDYFSITVPHPLLHIPQDFNFLVQQYIEGEDLNKELKQQGLFSETKVLDLLKNILPVLKFIHNKKVIHRDIKPQNIIRSTEEENKFYLIDFGAVKQVIQGDIDTKETSIVFGDDNYAPPEQRSRQQVNASSDLYALAATCVRLLTGEFHRDSRDVKNLWNWRKYPHISEPLGKILGRMLREDPYYRYQSATEVIEALDKIKPLNKPDESSTDTEIDPSDDTKGVINSRIVTEVIEPTDKHSKGKKINSKDDTKVINPHQFDPNPFPKFFIIIIGGIILSSTVFLAYPIIINSGGKQTTNRVQEIATEKLPDLPDNPTPTTQSTPQEPVDSAATPQGEPADSAATPQGEPADSATTPQGEPADSATTPQGEPADSATTESTPVIFQNLEALLKAGKWRDADLETWNLMLKLTKREQEGFLRIEDLKNFPRQELRKMDQLWVKYSNGKFGFSVQKQIWLELGGKLDGELDLDTFMKLGDRVGWRKNGDWLSYSRYTFSTNALHGHLPRVDWDGLRILFPLL
ncbi:GUN4 domain-containing protein [Sphaerospermopsis kisseleviana CS-549]|uniref:non-specific serine/threonine protein kinase n=1 Tax=Sphaerospermopsis kisseleviana CS-549 TaxID=3021783 RepID=A0ABT4ZNE3_9CYAN|nr:GUN4 domain-containing protein [Sphaerospermopsis kisseleviana]MDB9440574.1 GUN4 domain-containing protein [Sphaerospermopsis kisseleviana CS-549]BAZ83114.1 serine/threonine protein kinase [Sphaerospermopsis kisseleviana NIES-73]